MTSSDIDDATGAQGVGGSDDATASVAIAGSAPQAKRSSIVRRIAMRPRRVIVKTHRWLSVGLLGWLVVISFTGAWLVVHDSIESWFHGERYESTGGDVGPQAVVDSVGAVLPEGATVDGFVLPRNGRGVYQVYASVPAVDVPAADVPAADVPAVDVPAGEAGEAAVEPEPTYLTAFVDPGTAKVNGIRNEEEGLSWWFYRGHMYLWQDKGVFGVFNPEHGWCRATADGAEPGGVRGLVCDVIPEGEDMVGWFALGFIVVLLTGFYVWYWPGVRRWATAFVVRRGRGRFTFNMSLHKVIGFVVWVPLIAVAFTGAAFTFPNMVKCYDCEDPSCRRCSILGGFRPSLSRAA